MMEEIPTKPEIKVCVVEFSGLMVKKSILSYPLANAAIHTGGVIKQFFFLTDTSY